MGKKGWKGHRKSIPHNTPSKSPQNNGAEKQQPSANEIPAIDSSNAAVETENRERDEQDGDRQQDISADLPKEGKWDSSFEPFGIG
jgi:hypothetical protein